MTIPNLLSILRVILVPFFIVASVRGEFDRAFAIFVIAALTDALDGFLARKLNQTSRLGMLLDPAADKLMMASGFIVYTISDSATSLLPVGLTFTVFARDICLVLMAWMIYSRVRADRFPPTLLGKLSTILQAIALGVTIAANTSLVVIARWLLAPSHVLALGMTLLSGWSYIRQWGRFVDDPELAEREGVRFLSSAAAE